MWSSYSATATIIAKLRQHRLQLLHLEGLDDVALLDVLEALDADAALEALAHLGDVLLEMPQRRDLPFEDHAVVAQQAHAGGAGNQPVHHHAAGDHARLRNLERVTHLGAALEDLLELRIEHAGHGGLDLVDQVIDDR